MIKDDRLPLKEKFLEYYKELPVQKLAAAKVGRDEDTVIIWKNEDSDFSDQVEQAKADWALRNSKQVRSKEWLLERVMKDHFAQRSELSNPDGTNIFSNLTDEQLDKVIQSKIGKIGTAQDTGGEGKTD